MDASVLSCALLRDRSLTTGSGGGGGGGGTTKWEIPGLKTCCTPPPLSRQGQTSHDDTSLSSLNGVDTFRPFSMVEL